jgi:hypothetical protein
VKIFSKIILHMPGNPESRKSFFIKNGNERQSLSGTFDEKVGTFSCQIKSGGGPETGDHGTRGNPGDFYSSFPSLKCHS